MQRKIRHRLLLVYYCIKIFNYVHILLYLLWMFPCKKTENRQKLWEQLLPAEPLRDKHYYRQQKFKTEKVYRTNKKRYHLSKLKIMKNKNKKFLPRNQRRKLPVEEEILITSNNKNNILYYLQQTAGYRK